MSKGRCYYESYFGGDRCCLQDGHDGAHDCPYPTSNKGEIDLDSTPMGDRIFKAPGKFIDIGSEIGMLVSEKQAAYGDSFGRAGNVLRELFPSGIRPDQYDEVLTIARVLDKLFRISTKKDAFGENPWRDIAGYAILSVARDKNPKEK